MYCFLLFHHWSSYLFVCWQYRYCFCMCSYVGRCFGVHCTTRVGHGNVHWGIKFNRALQHEISHQGGLTRSRKASTSVRDFRAQSPSEASPAASPFLWALSACMCVFPVDVCLFCVWWTRRERGGAWGGRFEQTGLDE